MDSIVLAGLAITRGTILYGSFDNIGHKKFFIIIGENDEQLVGFFFINSSIHQLIKNKPAQFDMQMSIRKTDYSFLRYDSFISANKINTISKNKITSEIANQNIQVKDSLIDEDLNMLLDVVRRSKLFSKIEKETFFK